MIELKITNDSGQVFSNTAVVNDAQILLIARAFGYQPNITQTTVSGDPPLSTTVTVANPQGAEDFITGQTQDFLMNAALRQAKEDAAASAQAQVHL
jgi:hypothetical protein